MLVKMKQSAWLTFGVLAACGLLAERAHAGSIEVQLQPGPGAAFAEQAGFPLSQIESTLQAELNSLYRASEARRYLQAFADAQAFSNRGLGADYAGTPRTLIFGFAVNVSVNADEDYVTEGRESESPVEGMGANFSFMAGTNLHWLGLSPITLYANYFRGDARFDEFDGTSANFGVHGQLSLFKDGKEPRGNFLLSWGGIDITTGLERGQLTLTLSDSVKSRIPLAETAGGPYIEANTAGIFDADMRVWSVPLEVTTSLRLLYLLSFYGGLGLDWQFGSNELTMDLDSQLLGVIPGESDRFEVGSARLVARESVSPSPGKLRALAGVQVNLTFLRVFAHLNVMPDRGLVGVVTGARLAF